MDKPLAIVTGAAKGIGKAISLRLAAEGFFLVLVDIDTIEGKIVESQIGSEAARFISCDISSEEQVVLLFSEVVASWKNINVVVNNAGIIRDNVIWKMSVQEFDEVIAVNLRGCWLMCREAAKVMREQRCGRIINISSRGWLGNPGQTNYASSKAGIIGLTRVLALELGKYGVLVNAVAPGFINTRMTQGLKDEDKQRLIEAQPIKSAGEPEDVAHIVFFLASENTKFITGQVIYIDGGKTIGSNFV